MLTPFRLPISAISLFHVLSFNPDTFQNLSKTFQASIIDFLFFRKNAVSRLMLYIKSPIRKLSDHLSFYLIGSLQKRLLKPK